MATIFLKPPWKIHDEIEYRLFSFLPFSPLIVHVFNSQRKCGTPRSFSWRFWQNPNKKNEWNSTPMYDTSRLGNAPKGVPARQGLIHKKRVLFESPLFVGKLSDFQLRTAWSHFPYFTPDRSDNAKLGKSFNHANSTRDYLYIRFFNLDCHVYRCLTKWESISVVPILMNIWSHRRCRCGKNGFFLRCISIHYWILCTFCRRSARQSRCLCDVLIPCGSRQSCWSSCSGHHSPHRKERSYSLAQPNCPRLRHCRNFWLPRHYTGEIGKELSLRSFSYISALGPCRAQLL